MRPKTWAAILCLMLAPWANAQEARPASDWKKMYEDATAQLRAAQDRKSVMSGDIDRLAAQVADLRTRLDAAQEQAFRLQIQLDAVSGQSLYLDAVYSGWESFTRLNPDVRARWQFFWPTAFPGMNDQFPLICDPQWPLAAP